jgi:hypothetical protein
MELAERKQTAMAVLDGDGTPVAMLDQRGEFILRSTEPALVREYIQRVTACLMEGQTVELEVKHTFLEGMYMRELFIPRGTILVGKIHKLPCLNVVSRGDISILTETGTARVRAGYSVPSPAGLQKLGYAHEDTVFVNVFRTDETDPEKIEQAIAWESYEAAALAACEKGVLPCP